MSMSTNPSVGAVPEPRESDALNRASNLGPVAEDTFTPEQQLANWAAELNPDAFLDWIATLTIQEAETTIRLLGRIADEHDRRSTRASETAHAIRARLTRASSTDAERGIPLSAATPIGIKIGPGPIGPLAG